MADIGVIGAKRYEILVDVLGKLGLDLIIPPTKAQPIVTEKFYLDIISEIAGRFVVLEAACRVANKRNAERIADLEEAMSLLLSRQHAASEAADEPPVAVEAEADED